MSQALLGLMELLYQNRNDKVGEKLFERRKLPAFKSIPSLVIRLNSFSLFIFLAFSVHAHFFFCFLCCSRFIFIPSSLFSFTTLLFSCIRIYTFKFFHQHFILFLSSTPPRLQRKSFILIVKLFKRIATEQYNGACNEKKEIVDSGNKKKKYGVGEEENESLHISIRRKKRKEK